jgi:hypothetical protein
MIAASAIIVSTAGRPRRRKPGNDLIYERATAGSFTCSIFGLARYWRSTIAYWRE